MKIRSRIKYVFFFMFCHNLCTTNYSTVLYICMLNPYFPEPLYCLNHDCCDDYMYQPLLAFESKVKGS